MLKKTLTSLSLAFFIGCGGGEAPGVSGFSTVDLYTSIGNPTVDADIVNLSLDQTTGSCTPTIPQSDQQTLTITVREKPKLPPGTVAYPVIIDNLRISFTPAKGSLDPCFNNYSQPNFITTIEAGSSASIPIPVITQEIKECLFVRYLLAINPSCTVASFQFPPDNSPYYTVYATLSFRATEAVTGKSQTIQISFGTYKLNDYIAGGQ